METETSPNLPTAHTGTPWFSEDFICNSLERYLKENGYKIQKELYHKIPSRLETVVTASKFFSKEIIEVKGLPNEFYTGSNVLAPKNITQVSHIKKWFSDTLFNSFINFGKYYSNDSAVVCMALPNVDRYRAIIEKVQDYFSMNDLYFKIYLIDENGEVEVSNLNPKLLKASA